MKRKSYVDYNMFVKKQSFYGLKGLDLVWMILSF